MHDLIHNRAQSIVGYEVLIPRNAISHVSREVSHVSLLEKLNPMIKDKMEKKKKNQKGPYHGLKRSAVSFSP